MLMTKTKTKTYLIDDYIESHQPMSPVFGHHNNNNNNTVNNKNLSFNKCVTKLGDIVNKNNGRNGQNGQTQPFAPMSINGLNQSNPHANSGHTRVRHYSQQQLAHNWIHRSVSVSAKTHKDVDGMCLLS